MSVFVSFVHQDSSVAKALADFLRKNGNEVFLTADDWLLYAGEVWLDRIREELARADVVVTLISQRSIGRPWIHFEAGAAWLSGKLLIPVALAVSI